MNSIYISPLPVNQVLLTRPSLEGMHPAGRAAARRMEEPEIIDAYTDAQALEDGFLVKVEYDQVNRVTRAVFDHFARPMGSSAVMDITPVMAAIRTIQKLEADEDGWRSGTYEGKKLWLVPNEVERLTLMFPEDY